MSVIIDIFLFNLLVIPIILLITYYNNLLISFISLIIVGIVYQYKFYLRTYNYSWFEIVKFISGLLSIIYISYCRYYNFKSFDLTTLILLINIFEAIALDIITEGYANAIAGLLLIKKILLIPIDNENSVDYLFLYPTSINLILLYTTWNAAFSYGFGYSPSTRLILLSSIFISVLILKDQNQWLAVRTYALMVNMFLKVLNITYLYIPGNSYITPLYNEKNMNKRILWGLMNIVFMLSIE